ncbi:MAG TPA: sulfotransferase family protein [Acetobacteraceae bacterium]|nr:sulfotransferase family protein [Acetobacteraceae bacterium]
MDTESGALVREETSDRATPIKILKEATALSKEGRAGEALDLLLKKRDTLGSVPAAYHVAIGRLCADAGNHIDAIINFEIAKEVFGDDAAPGLHALLAESLLAVRRVEYAGMVLEELAALRRGENRPVKFRMAEEAAVAAYQNMRGKKPDKGKPTAYRIWAEAEVLAEQMNTDEALALLRKHRHEWDEIPPRYKALLNSLARKMGHTKKRIDRKVRKRQESGQARSAEDHRKLGTKLFDAGRFEEAAPELAAAVKLGAELDRRDIGMLADLYLKRNGDGRGYDTSFGRTYTLINHEKRLVYVSINKNASTLLKTNFILNSPHREAYLTSGKFIHQFCDDLPRATSRSEFLRPDYTRFTILREPSRRLVSAYLNKLVQGRFSNQPFGRFMLREHAVRRAQEMAGVPFDLDRSLTFEEFVHFIVSVEDYELNRHWLPQFRFVGTDLSRYEFVGKLEKLQDAVDYLTERFGFTVETEKDGTSTPIGGTRYRRAYTDEAALEAPYKALPAVLDRYENNMPASDLFYTPELRQLVERRFAEDFDIYRAV